MRKIYLIAFTLFFFNASKAQSKNSENTDALKLVVSNQIAIGLSDYEINNCEVQSTYFDKTSGATLVYLQQTYKNIPVYNQLKSLAFKNGKLISAAGNFIKNIDASVNIKTGIPIINATDALNAATMDRRLTIKENIVSLSSKNNGKKIEFGNLGIANNNITSTLMWFATENGKEHVRLGWQVYIVQKTSSDYWLVNIDAANKKTISIQNLTVYCNWDDPDKSLTQFNNVEHNSTKSILKIQEKNIQSNSPSIINGASYRVVPYPAESPIHAGGTPSLVNNPWLLSGAVNNATSLKWHSIGSNNYNITRGNNVWAQEDRDANNGTSLTQVTSTTAPDPLTFDFVPDFTTAPIQTAPIPNQQFNTTNLFYWNNIVHDITYQYGFDEVSRNFQADNQGRGGVGGDFVMADAQDGGGTNNANFSTPPDGSSGRMQMYLWTSTTPSRDGDVDNGVICHEYAHGISNRLTGNGSSCLSNGEQMGEGWSDYYGLMYTQDWANSNLNTGFNSPRGVGTYATGQSPTGNGIRSQKYCTNFAINNKVYAATIPSESHNRGEIWCAALWEMTWGIINQAGTINPNLFDASSNGGNSIALKLVTQGMKLQPCSPGFISGRDAILQADQILYGGAYRCTILEAFRKRGMGLGASEGSTGSVTDQIPSFTNNVPTLKLFQTTSSSLPEGQNINYTNRITTDICASVTGFTITDTLPTNVTYVGGGTYNAANRVVSFNITQAAGTTVDYNFVVNINSGSYFVPTTLLDEPVPATIPLNWTATTTVPVAGNLFTVSTLQSNSAPNAFFVENETTSTDKRLELNTDVNLPTGASAYHKLSFFHRFNTEDGWDGGVVEISTDGGTTWADLGTKMLSNKYNGSLGAGTGNNLSNRSAFTGLINSFINTTINLTSYAGQNIRFRFRFASDDNTAGTGTPTGWFIDDIKITNTATVSMRSSLFNASNTRVVFADTLTTILPPLNNAPIVTSQPSNIAVCTGNSATFTSAASGTGVTYSWQVSANNGATWAALLPAVTTTTLTLTAVTLSMNNNQYRIVATNGFGNATSSAAILTVSNIPTAPTTSTVSYCQGATAIALTATGTNLLWYTSAIGGTSNTAAPIPNTATVGNTTYYVSQSNSCGESPRANIVVTISATPTAPTVVSPITYCQGATAATLSVTGTNLLWYTSATSGSGSTSAPTPVTTNAGTIIYYVSQSSGGCESQRAAISVIINDIPNAPVVTSPIVYCQNSTAVPLTATGTNLKWYATLSGGVANTTAPTPITTIAGNTTYYVSQSNGTCESNRASIVVTVNATPTLPAVVSPIAYCQGSVADALTATGTNLLWYNNSVGGTGSANAPIPNTTTVGNATYYVSQTINSCEGLRAAIIVNINATPSAPTTAPITYCQGSTAISLIATGTNLLWYTSAIGGTSSSVAPIPSTSIVGSTTYYVSQSTGTCEGIRASLTVTVSIAPTIITQPQDITSCATSAIFSVIASGTNLNYQWQVSTDGGSTFTNMSAANNSTLILPSLTTLQVNYKYRAVVSSGTCSVAISNNVSAKIGVTPVVVLTASPTISNFNPYLNSGLFTTISPLSNYTYQWKRNNNVITNITPSLTKANGLLDDFGTYVVTVTDVNTGCKGTSNTIAVSDVADVIDRLSITPNPTQGKVKVWYYSNANTAQAKSINVYDSKGSRVLVKELTATPLRYGNVEIDLTGMAKDTYVFILVDSNSKIVATKKVVRN